MALRRSLSHSSACWPTRVTAQASASDRDRLVGEQVGVLPDRGAPGDLAAVARLRLLGDGDPLVAGLLAPAGDPTLSGSGGGLGLTGAVQGRQLADDDDLLAVDTHGRGADEPSGRQPPGEPVRRVVRRREVSLLPAARATERAAAPPATATEAGTEARTEPGTEALGERAARSEGTGAEAGAEGSARTPAAAPATATTLAALLAQLPPTAPAVVLVLVVFVVFVMTVVGAVLRPGRVLWCGVHVSPFRTFHYMITHLRTFAPPVVFPSPVTTRKSIQRTRDRPVTTPLGS